jgi:hypothetical protein
MSVASAQLLVSATSGGAEAVDQVVAILAATLNMELPVAFSTSVGNCQVGMGPWGGPFVAQSAANNWVTCDEACRTNAECNSFDFTTSAVFVARGDACRLYGEGAMPRLFENEAGREHCTPCIDIQPPASSANPTCASQLANTDKCAERRAGTVTDGLCARTCQVCVTLASESVVMAQAEKTRDCASPSGVVKRP